jgi:hypothetical protein
MPFEINFSAVDKNTLQMYWKIEEERTWLCSEPHELLSSLMKHAQALKFWRGESHLRFEAHEEVFELQFVDVFQGDISYQILGYGKSPVQIKKFKRCEYGRIGVTEFQECVYAAITDLLTRMGLQGYLSLFENSFSLVDYNRLAKTLDRPSQLEQTGLDFEPENIGSDEESPLEMIWETSEAEDDLDELNPSDEAKLLIRRPEFNILSQLIKQKNKKK